MASLKIQILPGWPPDMGNSEKKDKSIDELKQTILNVWENVSYNIINALVAEMPQRLIQVYSYEWNDNTTLMK